MFGIVTARLANRGITDNKSRRVASETQANHAPSRALLGEPLARARGRIHKVEGVRTIATFHPRCLLQRPSDKALAWRDLLLLMSESDR